MYVQASGLVSYLSSWKCEHTTLFDCMLQCGHDMARYGFWPDTDVEKMAGWIQDLAALGYVPPALLSPHTNTGKHTEQQQSRSTGGATKTTTVQEINGSELHKRWLQLLSAVQCRAPVSTAPAASMQPQGGPEGLSGAASGAAASASHPTGSNCSQTAGSAVQVVLSEASQHPEAWRIGSEAALSPPVYGTWAAVQRTLPQVLNVTHGTSGQDPVAKGTQWVLIHCRTAASLSNKVWQQWNGWQAIILVSCA